MNANGDERIDHDEFVRFFLKLLMGSHKQKMLIAFRCYDVNNDQKLTQEEIKVILKNVPVDDDEIYGDSRLFANDEIGITNFEYMKQKQLDAH